MNPKVTKLPGFPKPPAGVSPALRVYLEALAEALDIRLGRRGDPVDRAVTLRELISSGLAVELRANPFDPNNPSDNPGFVDPTKAVVTDIPLRPTGFSVAGAYSVINMVWDFANYSTHSLTEIWAHSSDSLGDATFSGSSTGRTYMDPVGSGVTRYYWIRHVNTAGTYGPWNSTTGTVGQTAADVDHLLGVLTDAITSSELATNLESRIDLIDGAATLQYSAAWRVAQEATARAAAIAALVIDIPIYDSAKDYAVGQIVRVGNTDSKLYIAIQAVSASANIALTNTAYWKVYGDYDVLKTSTDTSEAAITSINTISATSNSAAARSLHALGATVNNAATGVSANATAVGLVTTEVFPNGSASASRLDTLESTVNHATTGVSANATAVGLVTTEVFPNGSASASRIDTLESTVNHATTGVTATSTAVSTLNTEVFPNGSASASRIDGLESTVNHATTGVTATSTAVSTLNTEVFPNGTNSASRIDGLESVLYVSGSAVVSASNLSTMKTSILNANGTARASATQIDYLNASYVNPETGAANNVTLQQALNTTASNVDGLRGEYTVKVDANGHVAGFGLANTYDPEADSATSEFFVNADRFAILPDQATTATAAWAWGTTYSVGTKVKHNSRIYQARVAHSNVNPTASNSATYWDNLSILPFAVTAAGSTINGTYVPAGVYINSAMIKHASITKAQIGSVNADTIDAGTLNVADRITSDSIDVRKLVIGGSVIESEARASDGMHFLKIGAASITTALIDDLQVTTLKVAGNAITATGYAQKLFNSTNHLTLTMTAASNVTAGQPYIFVITSIVNNTSANNAVLGGSSSTYDLKVTTYSNGQSAQSNIYWLYAWGTDTISVRRTSAAAGHAVSCKVECFIHGSTTAVPSSLIQITGHTGLR
jgi:hypothetical protein